MAKNRKYQVEGRPRAAVDEGAVREEKPIVQAAAAPVVAADQAQKAAGYRFKGRGMALIGGQMVAFAGGVYETSDENIAKVLFEHGYERA